MWYELWGFDKGGSAGVVMSRLINIFFYIWRPRAKICDNLVHSLRDLELMTPLFKVCALLALLF